MGFKIRTQSESMRCLGIQHLFFKGTAGTSIGYPTKTKSVALFSSGDSFDLGTPVFEIRASLGITF